MIAFPGLDVCVYIYIYIYIYIYNKNFLKNERVCRDICIVYIKTKKAQEQDGFGNKLKYHFHVTTVYKYCFFVFCLYSSCVYLCIGIQNNPVCEMPVMHRNNKKLNYDNKFEIVIR